MDKSIQDLRVENKLHGALTAGNLRMILLDIDNVTRAISLRQRVMARWVKRSFAKQQPYHQVLMHLAKGQRWNSAINLLMKKEEVLRKQLLEFTGELEEVIDEDNFLKTLD